MQSSAISFLSESQIVRLEGIFTWLGRIRKCTLMTDEMAVID